MTDVGWLLFLVLMLGVGLGSAAAAWALRRPETVLVVGPDRIEFADPPTPEQVARFQEAWERMTTKDPDTSVPGQTPLDLW